MTITTRHPESRFGVPVVLDEQGRVIDAAFGVRLFRGYYGLKVDEFARMCNVTTIRVVEWEKGRVIVPVSVLNIIRDYLEDEKEKVMGGGFKTVNGKFRTGQDLLKRRLAEIDAAIRS